MIIYFTGTGNSRYLAKYLSEKLNDELIDSSAYLRNKENGSFTSDQPYIFVYPTYAYRMPHVFEDFIRNSDFQGNKKAYFIMNCGADTGNAIGYVERLCKEKNFEFKGMQSIVMPDNYVAMYTVTNKEEVEPLISKATKELDTAITKILNDELLVPTEVKLLDKLKSGVISDSFYKLLVKTKKFTSTDACTSCGMCSRVCPLKNIELQDSHPVWGNDCTHCMACISACPTKAIEYGKGTVGRDRYYLSERQAQKYIDSNTQV